MPLPQSFPLSAYQVRTELNIGSGSSISMLSAAVRTLSGQSSGDVKFSELLGKSNYNTKATFSFIDDIQYWTVPSGIYTVRVKCWGAGGGVGFISTTGARGGYSQAEFAVTPGQILNIVVGGGGISGDLGNSARYGGGGAGTGGGATGGGLCSVVLGTTWGIYAGGGGGTNDANAGSGALAAGNGGGANMSGGNAADSSFGNGGKGGIVSAGGSGGNNDFGGTAPAGSYLVGGNAGNLASGGGGGGYYGGGGGGSPGGSGGGGSGYVFNGTNVIGLMATGYGAPNNTDADYPGTVGEGSNSYSGQGGNGFAVIRY